MTASDFSRLVSAARTDMQALSAMGDYALFADEIFGFHAQQAAEKLLKGWLCNLTGSYPLTHDLSFLLRLLDEEEIDVTEWLELIELNAFAVQFRYETLNDNDTPLDRTAILNTLGKLEKILAKL